MRRWTVRIMLVIASVAACILPLEFVARIWIPRYGDALDRSMPMLRMDARLAWRQRENFSGRFFGHPVRTNSLGLRAAPIQESARAARRILVLGPSSTFGWGVAEEQTYSGLLERRLRQGGSETVVVNAGQIGFSAWQGLLFYKQEKRLQALHPQVLVFAYGVNDVDRHRFYFDSPLSDREELHRERSTSAIDLANIIGRLSSLGLARRRIATLAEKFSCRLGMSVIKPHELRVSPEDFERVLLEFVALSRERKTRLILMTSIYRVDAKRMPTTSSTQAYELSAEHARAGRCKEAAIALRTARKAEPRRIRKDVHAYNEIIRQVAQREELPLVDAQALLGVPDGEASLIDPVHPSVKGHQILADALAQIIVNAPLEEG